MRDPKTGRLSGGNPGNSGGKKGRSGRKPGSWKKWCMKVVSGPSAAKAIRKVLRNPEHPAFGSMVKFIGEQGYGKAEASVNVKADSLEALIAGSMGRAGSDDE